MKLFDTNSMDPEQLTYAQKSVNGGRVEDLPQGHCKSIDLPGGSELAVYNVSGEFYATENFCPHKGAPLTNGILCEHVIECDWHGWQFDVRTGECLTVPEKLKTYEVAIDDGLIKVLV